MLVRQLLRRCGPGVTRRYLSEGKRTSSFVAAQQEQVDPNKFIVRSNKPDVVLPEVTLPQYMWEKVDGWLDRPALTCSGTGRSYTYGQVKRWSTNLARSLRAALKLPRGSCIAILLPNVPEYPICILGAIEAGIVVTTVNPIYTADEIARQLVDAGARAIITLVDLHKTASAATKSSIPIITIKTQQAQSTPPGAINFAELCEKHIDNVPDMGTNRHDDVAIMPYSSGTTGLPKGVELTHYNLISNIIQCRPFNAVMNPDPSVQQTVSAVLPMFHIYGLTGNTLKMMIDGSNLVTLTKFTPDTYIDMLIKHKPELLFVVPPIVIFLAAHPDVKPEHLQHIRGIITGAAPLGYSDCERFFNKANKEIITLQGYGLTETSPAICLTDVDLWKECLGSIGMCLQNTELKVVSIDDGVTSLGPNEKGELYVRGPQVMVGYHNNPKATEDIFTEDGYMKTGDLVYYDENNILWICDRLKELIKVKGFQVAPAELEELIRNHPSVADAAIIGIPHELYGEVPKAYIVPKAGKTIDADKIMKYVASNVASYKKIEGGVKVLQTIPKTASGKILRRTLRQMHDEENN